MLWRIYYADGSTFDNLQGDPEDAPAFGVIAVVQPDERVGRQVIHQWDWYYWNSDAGQWWGGNLFGVLDRLLNRLPLGALLQGRMESSEKYSEIINRATNDPDFPAKSALLPVEKPQQ